MCWLYCSLVHSRPHSRSLSCLIKSELGFPAVFQKARRSHSVSKMQIHLVFAALGLLCICAGRPVRAGLKYKIRFLLGVETASSSVKFQGSS